MEKSAERILLTRLEANLCQQTGDEANATEKVSAYISELRQQYESQSDGIIEIPDEVTGLRRRYLEAVKANAHARFQHAQALRPSERGTPDAAGPESIGLLEARLDRLVREKQRSQLDIIDHYTMELDTVSRAPPAETSDSMRNADPSVDMIIGGPDMERVVQEKLRLLEMAVLQARHKANRERLQLQTIKTSAQFAEGSGGGNELQALNVVRRELTGWLEEILVKCSSEELNDHCDDGEAQNGHCDEGEEQKSKSTGEDVRDAYGQYFKAREKLSSLTGRESRPKSPTEAGATSTSAEATASKLPSQPHVDDELITQEHVATSRETKQSQEQMKQYLANIVKDERKDAIDLLQRLADESQLIPAYPILARSGKFDNATKTFGSRDTAPPPDMVVSRAEAWAFAAEAANDTNNATISKHLEQGHQAMNEVQNNLNDLRFLRDTAEEV